MAEFFPEKLSWCQNKYRSARKCTELWAVRRTVTGEPHATSSKDSFNRNPSITPATSQQETIFQDAN